MHVVQNLRLKNSSGDLVKMNGLTGEVVIEKRESYTVPRMRQCLPVPAYWNVLAETDHAWNLFLVGR